MPHKKQHFQRELLRSQKLKKRNQILIKPKFLRHISIILVIATSIGFSYTYFVSIIKTAKIQQQPKQWQIFFDYENQLSGIEKTRMEKILDKYLITNESIDLKDLSSIFLKDSQYNKLHIFKFHPSKIFISLSRHIGAFQIKVDTVRLVSEDGIIYGIGVGSKLPFLSGDFFPEDHNFSLKNSNEIAISKTQRSRLLEAVELMNDAKQENILFKEISFKKYRGYFASLKGTGTVISFGRRPFRGKIKKLRKILYKLSTRGQKASNIELDFEDKAFIKEYKL